MTTWQSAPVTFLAAAEGTEQVELTEPWQAVRASGGRPMLVSPAERETQLFEHLDRAGTMPVDVQVAAADPQDLPAFCTTFTGVFSKHV